MSAVRPDGQNGPPRRRRGCRSLVLAAVMFALGAGAAFVVMNWPAPTHDSTDAGRDGVDRRPAESARRALERLRRRVADIQARWEEWTESGEMAERLEALRGEVAGLRESMSHTARQCLDDLSAKSDALIQKARDRTSRAPEDLEEMKALIRRLERFVPGRQGDDDPQEEDSGDDVVAQPEGYRIGR